MRRLILVLAVLCVFWPTKVARAETQSPVTQLGVDGAPVKAGYEPFITPRGLPLSSLPVAASSAVLLEYTLPVTPTNLLLDNGGIWFTAFANPGLGYVDVASRNGRFYALPDHGALYDVKRDSTGLIWYGTTNAALGRDAIGAFNPLTAEAHEWVLPRNHFGLWIDPTLDDVWFVSKGYAEGAIGRLRPQDNEVTVWDTSPYTDTYDLMQEPGGQVWFTLQPRGLQGVGRLNQITGEVKVWTLPPGDTRPFRLLSASEEEVWLSEFAGYGFISRLLPKENRLERYAMLPGAASPAKLVRVGDDVWFTAYNGNAIGRLRLSAAAPISISLTATVITAPATTSQLAPVLVRPGATKFSVPLVSHTVGVGSEGPLTLYGLPWSNSAPFDLESRDGGRSLWFTALNVPALNVLVLPTALYLPMIRR